MQEREEPARGFERAPRDSDDHLVERVGRGDDVALKRLFDRHGPLLMMRLIQRSSSVALAEDALQETFIAIWKGATYSGRGEVAAWMWGIAKRQLSNQQRVERRHQLPPGELQEQTAWEEDALAIRMDLVAGIDALPERLREVVSYICVDGLSEQETSLMLGVPLGTVKSRLFRARRRLRGLL